MSAPLLFLTFTSALDPRFSSQGLPLLRALARRGQAVWLITFEPLAASVRRVAALQTDLAAIGLHWHPITIRRPYNRLADIAGLLRTLGVALGLILRHRLRLIHTRSYPPTALALLLRALTGVGIVFDMRGLLPYEYLSIGRWTESSLKYRLAKRFEALALRRSQAVIVTSELFRRQVLALDTAQALPAGALDRKLYAIHNTVDTDRFVPAPPGASRKPSFPALAGRRLLVLSAGTLMAWHLPAEVVRFFMALQRAQPDFALLILTRSLAEAEAVCRAEGLAASDYRILSVAANEMPARLAQAHAGISFLKPGHEMAHPIKLAEYLACGLPAVVSPGQGGAAPAIESARAGVVIPAFDPAAYDLAVRDLMALLAEPGLGARCRALAESRYSLAAAVDAYTRVYEQVDKL